MPGHLIRNPDAAAMRDAASHVVAWVNDPYSAPKEIRLSDLRNYVVALTSKLDVSLQEAADLVAQRVDGQVGRAPRRREPR
ncbi:terpene synthase family protein [Streptomyces sp. NPDC055107]